MDQVSPDEAKGPCAGFRVLEFGTMVSGPLAGQTLGDLGADVIKVETLLGDASKAREKLGWESVVSFDELVKLMIEEDIKEAVGNRVLRERVDVQGSRRDHRPGHRQEGRRQAAHE